MAGRNRIGIDLGGTKIEGVVLDGRGREAWRRRIAAPRGSYPATVAAVAGLAREGARAAGGPAPVGIGIPGAISRKTGLVKNANSTWLIGKPLRRDIEAALGRPVRIENDANCFAVSEAADGAGRGRRVVFGAILGTGVGAGIAIDGQPLAGANAIAGEWGHNPLPWPEDGERPGERCWCGRTGCVETFLSGPALSRAHERAAGTVLDAEEIAARAGDGDPAALATLALYEDRLARALAHVANLLDPDVVVLGGGLSNIGRLYARVPALWGRHVFSDTVETELRPPVHGDSSGVRGAARLWPEAEEDGP